MIQGILKFFFPTFFGEPVRARDDKGRLVGDDKSTPHFNEAWVGGQAPKKRGRPKGSKNKTKRSKK
jgi:hypothetical protein